MFLTSAEIPPGRRRKHSPVKQMNPSESSWPAKQPMQPALRPRFGEAARAQRRTCCPAGLSPRSPCCYAPLCKPRAGRAAAAQAPSKPALGSACSRSNFSAVGRAAADVGSVFARKLWQKRALLDPHGRGNMLPLA